MSAEIDWTPATVEFVASFTLIVEVAASVWLLS